jgi:hypothetical protein
MKVCVLQSDKVGQKVALQPAPTQMAGDSWSNTSRFYVWLLGGEVLISVFCLGEKGAGERRAREGQKEILLPRPCSVLSSKHSAHIAPHLGLLLSEPQQF